MSCRRAFDIDLAAFLSDAGGEEFAEFRGHYPVCPDCSTEVRAWTDLHALLQAGAPGADAGHPEPEMLLRYEQRDPPLGAEETGELERHLARCNTCREELAALRGFDFAALSAEVTQPEPVRNRLAELLSGLRGLLLHPAFAYALVLVLLYPTVTTYLEGPGIPEPELAMRRDVAPVAPQPQEKRVAELGKRRGRMAAEPPRSAPAEDLPVAGAFAYREAPVLGESEALEPTPRLSVAMAQAPPWVRRLHVPEQVRSAPRFEVRVVHADGLREVRQRFVSAEAGDEVEISLPPDWRPTDDDRVEFKALR